MPRKYSLNPYKKYSQMRRAGVPRALRPVIKAKPVKTLTMTKPMKELVNKEIDRSTGTQHMTYHQRRYQFTNLISDDPQNRLHAILPDIATGTLRDDRLGSQIRLLNINLKGRIDIPADDNPLVGNDDRAQIYVRMMVLSLKVENNLPDVKTNWNTFYNDVLFKNNASPSAPQGKYVDMLSSINHEAFTTHYDKVIKLDRRYPFFPDPTSTSGAASQVPISREFSFNLKCKNKKLLYNTPSSTQPRNYQPFVCCLFAYGNGAQPSTSAVPFIEYMSKVSFKA